MRRTELRRGKPLSRSAPMRRRGGVKRVNRKRRAKRFAREFAKQADLCRRTPCAVCTKLGKQQTTRTHPHHEPPRGVGLKSDDSCCVPLCAEHHDQRHTWGSCFWTHYGVDWMALRKRMRILVADENTNDLPLSPLLLWLDGP